MTRIAWSLPVRGEGLDSHRGDVVRARHLIAALRELGHEVVVVADSDDPAARRRVSTYRGLVRRVLPRRVAGAIRDVGRVLHARAHAARVAEAIRELGCELLVETQVAFAASGSIAAGACGVPLVLDDCSPSIEEDALGAELPSLARRALRRQASAACVVVAVSRAAADALAAEGVPRDRLRLVPNGVDLAAHDMARAAHDKGEAARATRDTAGAARDGGRAAQASADARGSGACTAIFVGSFQPWHRVERLIEATERAVRREGADLRVLLVGDGPGRELALETARRAGIAERVEDLGPISSDRVPEALARADVGVLPATNDWGHPMKLVEYAASRLACVAPNVPTVREVLTDGETGLLFRDGDVDDLAASLARLAGEPELARRLGEGARERVAGPAAWSERARRLLP